LVNDKNFFKTKIQVNFVVKHNTNSSEFSSLNFCHFLAGFYIYFTMAFLAGCTIFQLGFFGLDFIFASAIAIFINSEA